MTFSTSFSTAILGALPVGVVIVDKKGCIRFSNSHANKLFGYEDEQLLQKPLNLLIPMPHRNDHERIIAAFFANPQEKPMSRGRLIPAVTKDGHKIGLEIGLTPFKQDGEDFVIATLLDTQNKAIIPTGFKDELTLLPNRTLFYETVEKLKHLAIRNSSTFTVIFIDLDGFKVINDTHGHAIGDAVLSRVAETIRSNIRTNDVAARIGGDEFLVGCYGFRDERDAINLANKIRRQIEAIDNIDGYPIQISASIGVAVGRELHDSSVNDLIKEADTAMYHAKKTGKGRVVHAPF